jgi:hypothetical protein
MPLPSGLEALPALLTVGEVATVLRTTRKAVYSMAERWAASGHHAHRSALA